MKSYKLSSQTKSWLVPTVILMWVALGLWDPPALPIIGSLAVFLLCFFVSNDNEGFNIPDIALFAIGSAICLLNLFVSILPANSLQPLGAFITALLLAVLVQYLPASVARFRLVVGALTAGATVVAYKELFAESRWLSLIHGYRINPADLHFLIPSIIEGVGHNQTVVLLVICIPATLSFAFSYPALHRVIVPCALLLVVLWVEALLSFQRGVYVSLAVFLAVFCCTRGNWSRMSRRERGFLLVPIASALIIVSVICPTGLLQTMRLLHTSSQRRSAVGRTTVWINGISHLSASRLFLGYGFGNFAIATTASQDMGEASAIGRPFNLIVDVLVGFGILPVCLLVTSYFLLWFRTRTSPVQGSPRKDTATLCCLAGLAGVICHEMFDSSLFATYWGALACAALTSAGVLSHKSAPKRSASPHIYDNAFTAVFIACTASIGLLVLANSRAEEAEGIAISAANNGHVNGFVKRDSNPLLLEDPYWYAIVEILHSGLRYDHKHHQVACGSQIPSGCGRIYAVDALDEALRLDPNSSWLHETAAWLLYAGHDPRAWSELDRAEALHPGNAETHVIRSVWERDRHNTLRANTEAAIALSQSPHFVESQWFSDIAQEDAVSANNIIDASISEVAVHYEQSHSPIAAARLGRLYLYKGDYLKAKYFIASALASLASLSEAWVTQGDIYFSDKNVAAAYEAYRTALMLEPDSVGARIRLCRIAPVPEISLECQEAREYRMGPGIRSLSSRESMIRYNKTETLSDDSPIRNWLSYCCIAKLPTEAAQIESLNNDDGVKFQRR